MKKHVPAYKRLNPTELYRLKRQALTDPWAFVELIDFHGGQQSFDPIHKMLLQHLTSTHERRLVLMPRGHFKSTLCSTLYVLWRIYKDPNIRIMVGSALKELATGFVRELKQYFEDPDLQTYVWNDRPHIDGPLVPDLDRTGSKRKRGSRNDDTYLDSTDFGGEEESEATDKKVVWRANAIQVLRDQIFKEPTVFACSVGVMMTGWHYDLCLFDDIITFENADNRAKAEKILGWVKDIESVINVRDEETGLGDESVVLGTRYFEWDYYGHLMGEDLTEEADKEEWLNTLEDDPVHVIARDIYGNGFMGIFHPDIERVEGRTAEDGYMCPRLMDPKRERKLRRRLGNRRFSSQYLNKIVAEEDIKLQWYNVQWIHPMGVDTTQGMVRLKLSADPSVPPVYIKPVIVVDPAYSLKETADYTMIVVGGVDYLKNYYVLDVKYGHWTATKVADILQDKLEQWNLQQVVIETNGPQVGLVNSIKEHWATKGFNAYICHDIPKGDKKQKILDCLEPIFENRRIWMMNWMATHKELQQQIEYGTVPSMRDDFPDCLEKLTRYARPLLQSTIQRRLHPPLHLIPRRSIYGGVNY